MKIKCIDNTWNGESLTVGKIYDVIAEEKRIYLKGLVKYYKIVDDKGVTGCWWQKRFVKIK